MAVTKVCFVSILEIVRFSVYKKSFLFGLSQVSNYRVDMFVSIISKIVSLLGVVFLWSIVGKSTGDVGSTRSLLAYFLIANGVQGLVDGESLRFSKEINQNVKLGGLSALLLRPVNPILYMYSSFWGTRGVPTVMQIILIGMGFSFLDGVNFIQIGLFVLSLILAFVVAFVFNMFIGSLSFWAPEAHHFQNVMSHILRVFSGVLIPVTFFSGLSRQILLLSPFPILAYLPSTVLQKKVEMGEVVTIFGASIFWCIVLLPASIWFWKKGVRRYEAIGI